MLLLALPIPPKRCRVCALVSSELTTEEEKVFSSDRSFLISFIVSANSDEIWEIRVDTGTDREVEAFASVVVSVVRWTRVVYFFKTESDRFRDVPIRLRRRRVFERLEEEVEEGGVGV